MRPVATLLSLASCLLVQAAPYRISEDFELVARRDAIPSKLIPLGDGSHLAVGGFDSLEDELTGALAVLTPAGLFEPLSLSFPVLGAQVEQAVRNTDGSLSVLFTNIAPDLGLTGNTVIQFSPSGEVLLAIANEQNLTLQKDNRFLQIIGETDPNQPAKQFSQVQRLVRSSNGKYVLDPSFSSPRVEGLCRAIHILANGKILVTGSFPNSATLATGNLMLLEPDGQLTPGFNRFGYRNVQLEYNAYQVSSLPNGDLFLLYAHGDFYFPTKISSDGKRDNSFGVANQVSIYYKSPVFAAGDGAYFVVGPWNQVGVTFSPVIKLKANGQIDETFTFNANGFFSAEDRTELFAAAMTPNGLFLSGRPSSDPQKIAYAFLSPNGALTEAQTDKLYAGKSTSATWTPSGELLMEDGIARVDGTIRVSFERDYELKLTPLKNGSFTTADFVFYDENRNRLPVQPHFDPALWFLAQMPNGQWLAEQRASKWGQPIGVVKLHQNGSIDTTFPMLDPETSILAVTGDHIYYAFGKSANIPREVRRMSYQGLPDASFSIPNLAGDLTTMKVAADWIYFRKLTVGAAQTPKPLGARFSLTGQLDGNYAPENTLGQSIDRRNRLYSQNANHFADDGSTAVFGYPKAQASGGESEQLWSVSPEGIVSEVDDRFRWRDADVDIAPNGDLYVTGIADTAIGPLATSTRYTRSPASFSTPFLERVSYSETPVKLEATVTDIAPDSIVWLKDGVEIPGANSATLAFDQLDTSHAGDYLVRTQSGQNLTEFGPIRLIRPRAPTFLAQPQDQDANTYGTLSLEASIEGLPYPKLQWYVDGLPIEGATSPKLTLKDLSLKDIGTYQLKSTNPLGTQWSAPALVQFSSIIPSIEKTFDVGREGPLYASALIRSPDGGYFVQSLGDPTLGIRPTRTDYVDEDGNMTIDWGKDRIPAGYGGLSFCRFTGTQFAVKTEYKSDGSGDTITHFTRITQQGAPDTAFGVHRIDGNFFTEIAFRQWPDGTVWVEEGRAAREISPSGVATPLPEKTSLAVSPNWIFIHPLSMRLDDGTYTLTLPSSHWLIHVGSDGSSLPDSDIIDIGYSPTSIQFVGIWANGTQLLHDPVAQTLSGKTFAGQVLWTIDLAGWSVPTNILAATSPDETRLTLLAQQDSEPQTTRVFWVEADGSNNFSNARTFSGLLSYQQIVGLKNNAFALHGFTGPSATREIALFVDSDNNASTPTKLTRLEPAYLGNPVPSLGGQNLYLPLSGEHIDGALTGPLLKLDASGTIDPTFFATFPENALPVIRMVCPMPLGYLAVLRGQQYGYDYEIHVLDPQGAPASYISLGTLPGTPPFLLAHPSDQAGFLVVSIEPNSNEAVRLDRYLADGTLAPAYFHGIKKAQYNYTQVISDSRGRVYLYRQGFSSTPAFLIRVKSNGEIDETFTLDPSITQISAITLDSNDRLIVGDARLLRLQENGTIDTAFSPQSDPIQFRGLLHGLPSGDIIANNKRYDQNGTLKQTYVSSNSFLTGKLFGEQIVSANWDHVTKLSTLNLFSLEGLPKIENQPRSQSIPLGSPLTLALNASEKPGLRYRWTHNGTTLPDQYSSRLSFDSVQAANAGSYQVTIIWNYGSLTLPEFNVTTTTALPNSHSLPPITYQITPAGIEFSWTNDQTETYELLISEDLQAWQVAPFPSASELRIQKSTATFENAPAKFFIKLRPSH